MMQELNYIRCGDYYILDICLPDENSPIGRWGCIHRDYIKEHNRDSLNSCAFYIILFLALKIKSTFKDKPSQNLIQFHVDLK